MPRIYEFALKSDYNSPNSNLQQNQVVFKKFKKGDTFVGFILNKNNSNIGTQPLPTNTIVDQDNWMVPLTMLDKKPNSSWDSFEAYNKEKKTISTSEFPPEIQQKINDIAERNMAKNMGKMVKKNLNLAFILGGGGAVYAFMAKKNIYLYGIGGILAGIALTMFMNNRPAPEQKTEEKETKN